MEKFCLETIRDAKRRQEVVEIVEKGNYKNFLGFYSFSKNVLYENPVEIPKGWMPAMELEH